MSRPVTPADEFITHGVPASVDASAQAQRAWFDHTEMMIVPPDPGDPIVNSYFQAHQSIGMLHGYTIVLHEGSQHNVKGGRELTAAEDFTGRVDTTLGPIAQAVVDPFARWTFSLEPTADSDIAVEAVCVPSTPPNLWPRMEHPIDDPARYHTRQDVLLQLITVVQGHLRIGSRTWDIAGWRGFRDHCWGFRLPAPTGGPSVHTWLPAFFPARQLLLMHRENTARESMYSAATVFGEKGVEDVAEISMGMAGEPGQAVPTRVEWDFEGTSGSHHLETGPIEFENATFIAGGWMGESADEYYGPFRVEADTWGEKERREAAKVPGIRGMARYRVPYRFDDEEGYGLLAAFMANDYEPTLNGA
ncbi:MAG TPA: hypothetical protein VH275_00605 [Solirubrobacterales bacterium]|jgi:hypothetical protein|nr:hypothetical protein [Solirubrobacterales bacterium]